MKKFQYRNRHIVFMACVTLFASGCAGLEATPTTGFLDSYEELESVDEDKELRVFKSDSLDPAQYHSFIVDSVSLTFDIEAKANEIEPEKIVELKSFFREQLIDVFSSRYTQVTTPGPGVLRVRTALTEMIANKVYLNLHWSTTLAGFGIGGASFEAEVVDSQTGERLASVVDTRRGKRIKYTKGLSKWGHTKDVFIQWSEVLAEQFGILEEDLEEEESSDPEAMYQI